MSKKNSILFVSIELPRQVSRSEIESEFGTIILSTIEKSLVAQIDDDRFIFISAFKVVTFCNFTHEEIKGFLKRIDIKEADRYAQMLIHQDYPFELSKTDTKPLITNFIIKYHKFDKDIASIISLALSRSVGLESKEKSLEQKMLQSAKIYEDTVDLKIKDRKALMSFASSIAKERFEILNKLYLLDKPDIIWDDVELESFYNQLSSQLELKSRFEVIEYKINYLKESVDFAINRVNQKSSEFLEWIIIWLIVIEVLFSTWGYIIKPMIG